MKIVVTGSGRSGTGWCAAVLNSAGIFSGHENVFGPRQTKPYTLIDWCGYNADCSWLAVPRLPMVNVKAALVVRDPLAVVASMEHIMFGKPDYENQFSDVAARAGMTPDLDGYLRFWLDWNRRAVNEGHVEVVFTLDQLVQDPALLTYWAGARYEPKQIGVVNERPEFKVNERPVVDWDSFGNQTVASQARQFWESLAVRV